MTTDLLKTVKQPAISMRDLVYGKPVARSPRFRLPSRFIFIGILVGMYGCATVPPRPTEAEVVGQLSASATHVYVQPVHADTDLSIAYQPAGGDEDAAEPMKVAAKPDAAPAEETPEVIEKPSHGF